MERDELRDRVWSHIFRSLEATGLPISVKSPQKHSGLKQRLCLAHHLETRNMGSFFQAVSL